MAEKEQNERLFPEFPPVSVEEWEAQINADLKGADYARKLIWKTDEGFDVRPYYRAEDLKGLEYLDVPPGEAPFVRGTRTKENAWIIRKDIAETDIRIANRKALEAIKEGAGAVGFNVTEITTHKQLMQLLEGISFAATGIHFVHSRSFPLSLELLLYELTNRNEQGDHTSGSLNFDLIAYLLLHGDFYRSLESNVEEAVYLMNTVQKRVPRFRAITVNSHLFQDAGSTLVQELAFALASGNEYMAMLTDKGFSADAVASRLSFTFAIGPNYFMEIAKLRAARLLWARIVEQYGPSDENSMKMDIQSRTALWNKTIYDPYVNMLRTTTEGMSAILGNTDTLVVLPFDAAYATPDDFSERIALNQQMIMKEESYLDRIVDPAAGSYYIENLTNSIATEAWALFRRIEEQGGMIAAIKAGTVQDMVAKSAMQKTADLAKRKLIQIGTNQYPNSLEQMLDKADTRPQGGSTGTSTYPRLQEFRVSSGFESLRLATEQHVKNGGKRPDVFLFTFGNLSMLRARASFITNFFGCAGYNIQDNPGFTDFGEGAEAAVVSGAEIIVLCSSDEEALQAAPEICRLIHDRKPDAWIVMAGYPKDDLETLKAAGVNDFVHVRSNLLETLSGYQQRLGIK
ncbi:MAG TPA: methylmalonyl-CoA mutase family protein [Bacteroidales bacterium]|nr:methylmalonyl-CoA mutase family protein [Bacteroidales bacterium]